MKNKYRSKEYVRDFGPITFGNLVLCFRLAEALSQKEFSASLELSPKTLSLIEKEKRIPTLEMAILMARKLKEPVSYWVQLALQDLLNHIGLKLKVSVA
jgi:DNA-binding XRE family transcriptional regulator